VLLESGEEEEEEEESSCGWGGEGWRSIEGRVEPAGAGPSRGLVPSSLSERAW